MRELANCLIRRANAAVAAGCSRNTRHATTRGRCATGSLGSTTRGMSSAGRNTQFPMAIDAPQGTRDEQQRSIDPLGATSSRLAQWQSLSQTRGKVEGQAVRD